LAKQETEILKGTLEGVVLTALSIRSTHGYEIVAWLRVRGFEDIAEGTVYALLVRIEQRGLVDVEKVPSEKGPSRKVYSVNSLGHKYLADFWATWTDLSNRIEQLKSERRVT
jgi:PadR family transcriptional regulator PadR